MTTIHVPWTDGQELAVPLPAGWRLAGIARPPEATPIANLAAAVRAALQRPVDLPALSLIAGPETRAVIIVDDASRRTPTRALASVVLDVLRRAGVRPDNVEFLFAVGMHRAAAEHEVREKLGSELASAYRVASHDARDRSASVRLGATRRGTPAILSRRVARANLRILVGTVEPHLQAGFSGGWKLLTIGCAYKETIRQLHDAGMTWPSTSLVGQDPDENLMRREIREVGRLVPAPTLALNVVMDVGGGTVDVAAGEPDQVLRRLVPAARRAHGVAIDRQADIVLTAASPMTHDLLQSLKSCVNVQMAARPGGVLAPMIANREGFNHLKFGPVRMPPQWLVRHAIRLVGGRTIMSMARKAWPMMEPHETLFLALGTNLLARNSLAAFSPQLADERRFEVPSLEVFSELAPLLDRAACMAGRRRPAVLVFPHGGVCYPILPGRSE